VEAGNGEELAGGLEQLLALDMQKYSGAPTVTLVQPEGRAALTAPWMPLVSLE